MQNANLYNPHINSIRIWLYIVSFLIFSMAIVGGATRLTGSGLSITEWKPILGIIPPLSHADWLEAFEKYKQIPQYIHINKGMTLTEFKPIFWWEWAHRFFGRIIGLAFAVPFIIFTLKKMLSPALFKRCLILLSLGAVQGFMGWYMVQSGLVERVSVSHFRLAAHLTLAAIIYAAVLYTIFELSPKIQHVKVSCNTKHFSIGLLILLFIQIIWGAFVAGSHSGFIYNTWPLMDEQIIPKQLYSSVMTAYDFMHDQLPLQFTHRTLAYILLILTGIHAHFSRLPSARWLFSMVIIQSCIGILTLVNVTPLGLALLHQGFAFVVILFAILHVYILTAPLQEKMLLKKN